MLDYIALCTHTEITNNCDCLKNEQVAKYKLWHIVASTLYIILHQNNLRVCIAMQSVQDISKQCVREKYKTTA